jgi:hypothetical protein
MKTLVTMAERAHYDALCAARRAIRAGDLTKAERWMKLAHIHWQDAELARQEAERLRQTRYETYRRREAARARVQKT